MFEQSNHPSDEMRARQRPSDHQPSAANHANTDVAAYSPSLLFSLRNIGSRGNSLARASFMHSMQRTHGNAATHRAVQRTPVQRDTPPGTEMADKPDVDQIAAQVYAQVQAMLEVMQARNGDPSI
jgi:hypothetical protein